MSFHRSSPLGDSGTCICRDEEREWDHRCDEVCVPDRFDVYYVTFISYDLFHSVGPPPPPPQENTNNNICRRGVSVPVCVIQ